MDGYISEKLNIKEEFIDTLNDLMSNAKFDYDTYNQLFDCGCELLDQMYILGEVAGKKKEVKFISYDGKYPNLCRGNLVIEVEGKKYELSHCLMSGGRAYFDSEWNSHIEYGAWSVGNLPAELELYRQDIEAIVNDNVEYGCCGGCL